MSPRGRALDAKPGHIWTPPMGGHRTGPGTQLSTVGWKGEQGSAGKGGRCVSLKMPLPPTRGRRRGPSLGKLHQHRTTGARSVARAGDGDPRNGMEAPCPGVPVTGRWRPLPFRGRALPVLASVCALRGWGGNATDWGGSLTPPIYPLMALPSEQGRASSRGSRAGPVLLHLLPWRSRPPGPVATAHASLSACFPPRVSKVPSSCKDTSPMGSGSTLVILAQLGRQARDLEQGRGWVPGRASPGGTGCGSSSGRRAVCAPWFTSGACCPTCDPVGTKLLCLQPPPRVTLRLWPSELQEELREGKGRRVWLGRGRSPASGRLCTCNSHASCCQPKRGRRDPKTAQKGGVSKAMALPAPLPCPVRHLATDRGSPRQ